MTLSQLREEIDRLDGDIAALLVQRLEICRQVGFFKKEQGLPVSDPVREAEKCAALAAEHPEWARELAEIYERVFAVSRGLQERITEDGT